jgi:hypothetical protein
MARWHEGRFPLDCAEHEPCVLLAIDLAEGGEPEYCLLRGSGHWLDSSCFERRGEGSWEHIGKLQRSGTPSSSYDLLEVLRREGARVAPSRYRDLELGGETLRLLP